MIEPEKISADTILQVNATIIAGILVLASVASIFPIERRLDFTGLVSSDPEMQAENRRQLEEQITAISRSGNILFITGILIAPFGASTMMILTGHPTAGKFALATGIGLIVVTLIVLGMVFAWLGLTFNDLLSRAP